MKKFILFLYAGAKKEQRSLQMERPAQKKGGRYDTGYRKTQISQ